MRYTLTGKFSINDVDFSEKTIVASILHLISTLPRNETRAFFVAKCIDGIDRIVPFDMNKEAIRIKISNIFARMHVNKLIGCDEHGWFVVNAEKHMEKLYPTLNKDYIKEVSHERTVTT